MASKKDNIIGAMNSMAARMRVPSDMVAQDLGKSQGIPKYRRRILCLPANTLALTRREILGEFLGKNTGDVRLPPPLPGAHTETVDEA
jgi:hypothetical protein